MSPGRFDSRVLHLAQLSISESLIEVEMALYQVPVLKWSRYGRPTFSDCTLGDDRRVIDGL